jgi:hypothetical protein
MECWRSVCAADFLAESLARGDRSEAFEQA